MKKPQKMEDDQFYRELPIWMQSMIQWLEDQMKSYQQPPQGRKAGMDPKGGRHSPLKGE
jgi:hypothetical protein